jgi:hypothetical protein
MSEDSSFVFLLVPLSFVCPALLIVVFAVVWFSLGWKGRVLLFMFLGFVAPMLLGKMMYG